MLDASVLDKHLSPLLGARRWLVGYSGGVDSIVLLSLLVAWRSRATTAPPLAAIHVNHQLQPQARTWQAHCQAVCDQLEVPLVTFTVDADEASRGEEGARDARYAAFSSEVGEHDVLFLAHHLDDQIETFFQRLLRGAGVEGLAAMHGRRKLGGGDIVRPLLDVTREEIRAFALANSLPVVEDPSNASSAPDRNFLRNEVLPVLARRWPGYRRSVSRAIAHLGAAAEALEDVTTVTDVVSVTGDPGIALAALPDSDRDAMARQLRSWLRQQQLKVPDQSLLEEFLRQLCEAPESAPALQAGDYTLRRFGTAVYRLPNFVAGAPVAPLTVVPGETYHVAGAGTVRIEPDEEGPVVIDAKAHLQLRWRNGGERFRPAGRSGSTALKKWLQERAVPPWWRSRLPLLYDGEELLAVADLGVAGSATGPVDTDRPGAIRCRLRWEKEGVVAGVQRHR